MANLKDIAKIAGVNASTVSRALNNSRGINERTKNEICKIAREINYIPDQTARALVGKGTKTIGVILQEISSDYYTKLLAYIEQELRKDGYSILMGFTNHDFNIESQYLRIFNKRRVDGIILAGYMYKELEAFLDSMRKIQETPMILIQTHIKYPKYDHIMVDEEYGFDIAIKHLKSLGHERIGIVADEVSSQIRLDILRGVILANGLKYDQRYVKVGKERFEQGGYLRMKELLRQSEIPTAVIATYDHIAIGALKALYDANLKVGEDISIVSYDNIRESEFLVDPLTTISPPIEAMTELGVKLLLEKIESKEKPVIQHISLKPELILRNTTGEPRRS
jgi:LacI family transcriptional regulator